jgi:hypothetical protein
MRALGGTFTAFVNVFTRDSVLPQSVSRIALTGIPTAVISHTGTVGVTGHTTQTRYGRGSSECYASLFINIEYKSSSAAALDLIVHTCETVLITIPISQLTRARDTSLIIKVELQPWGAVALISTNVIHTKVGTTSLADKALIGVNAVLSGP